MGEYFPKPKSLGAKVKNELVCLIMQQKQTLKMQQVLIYWILIKKTDEAYLKSDADKIYIDKLKNVPINLSYLKIEVGKSDVDKLVTVLDFSKLSDVVKNDGVGKDVYSAKIKNIEDKVPDIINLATSFAINAKIIEVKNKILNITKSAITVALSAMENKKPNVGDLVKKNSL